MKKTVASSLVLALAALVGTSAMASVATIDPTTGANISALRDAMNAPSSLTREQVKAELIAHRAAQRTVVIDPVTGANLADLRAAGAQSTGKTREQVRAELFESRRYPSTSSVGENLGN